MGAGSARVRCGRAFECARGAFERNLHLDDHAISIWPVPYVEVTARFPNQRGNHRDAKSHAREFAGKIFLALHVGKPGPAELLGGKGLPVIYHTDTDEAFVELPN